MGDLLDVTEQWARDHDGRPGWSSLLDLDDAPAVALPWLGQFVGVTVDQKLDAVRQRDVIRSAAGFARGSVAALKAAAQTYLTGTKHVDVFEREGEGVLPATVLADSPSGYWKLSGDVLDSKNGFNLTNSGVTFTAGWYPGTLAGDFDGAADYLEHIAFNPSLVNGCVFEAVIVPDASNDGNTHRVIHVGTSGAADWAFQITTAGKLQFFFVDTGATTRSVLSATTLVAGQRYHVMGTWDGRTLAVVVNGVVEAATVFAATPRDQGDLLWIGRGITTTSYFDGRISHVALYTHSVTATRVGDHYAAGTTGSPYRLRVRVYAAEVAGLTYGALSVLYPTYGALDAAFGTYGEHSSDLAKLLKALADAKPAGLVMTVEVTAGSPP